MRPRHDPVSLGSPRFHTAEHGAFLVTAADFPGGLVLPLHTHERPVLAITLSGQWDSVMNGRAHESTASYVLTEPAAERHANHFAAGLTRVVVVQPDPACRELFHPCRRLLEEINHFPVLGASITAARLAREVLRPDGVSPLAVQSACLDLCATATRAYAETIDRAPSDWLSRVQEYLHAHFLERPSVATLARVADVHPAHLARAFRTRLRTSPAQYVRALRLEWAAERLETTDLPISEIAQAAGFADQSHFTRRFRHALGSTPATYRVSVGRQHKTVYSSPTKR